MLNLCPACSRVHKAVHVHVGPSPSTAEPERLATNSRPVEIRRHVHTAYGLYFVAGLSRVSHTYK
eukprot:30897-Pelagococcus_subviridis.AAC.10